MGGEAYLKRLDTQLAGGWFGTELTLPVKAYIKQYYL
jgi:hypothetical protein